MQILKIVFATIVCVYASSCEMPDNSSPTGETSKPRIGEQVISTTSRTGTAFLQFPIGDRSLSIDFTLRDFDTKQPVAGVNVHAVALANGIFIRTEDSQSTYFTSTQYVPYEAFTTRSGQTWPQNNHSNTVTSSNLVVAIIGFAVAAYNVGSFVYEYTTDPPGIKEFFADDDTVQQCLTGDLNDVLKLIGANAGGKTISGIVQVFGVPASMRNVTAINLGFTGLNVVDEIGKDQILDGIDNITGILSTDVKVWCWPKVNGQGVPVIRGNISRIIPPFAIIRVHSQGYYPVTPPNQELTTSIGVEWVGTPKLPVTMTLTSVSCYPGWTCGGGPTVYTSNVSPYTLAFGCIGEDPQIRSGFITYQVELRDSAGVETPPATFTFRCGSP